MNLKDIYTEVRNILSDTTIPYQWSDNELRGYVNQSIIDASIRSRCIVDSTSPDCSILNVVAGKSNYPIHESVFYIERVYDSVHSSTLTATDTQTVDSMRNINGSTDTNCSEYSRPEFYIADLNHCGTDTDGLREISIYPTPSMALTLNLTVIRTPLEALSDGDIPEIPFFHHYALIYGALALAYQKHDADTEDRNKSAEFEAQFTQVFGDRPTAKFLQWGRQHKVNRVRSYFK